MNSGHKKRVLIFSTAYFPYVGGAEVAVKEITERLADEYSWDMVTVRLKRSDPRMDRIGGITVYRLGWGLGRIDKLLFPFRAAKFASILHKKYSYDLVWSIMASFSGLAAVRFKSKYHDLPYLLTLQEGDDLEKVEKKILLRPIKKWFYDIFQLADAIQAISGYLKDWAKKMGAKCEVIIIPNGARFTDSLQGNVCAAAAEELRRVLGCSAGKRIILSTSRLAEKNGLDDLIKAMLNLKDLPVKLVICGDGEDRPRLESLINRLNLSDRVILAGSVPRDEIEKYYCLAACSGGVFCRPSLSEGLGNSFLEAMSYNIPIIGTRVGGIPDFLKDGKTGFFCERKNSDSIAEKIRYILDESNKQHINRVVNEARNLVKERFEWGDIAERVGVLIRGLTGN